MAIPQIAVLDACALIAYFNDEPGADEVESIFSKSDMIYVHVVNVLEVAYDAVRVSGDIDSASEILAAVAALPCTILWSLSETEFMGAARLKAKHRISLADAIALGVAAARNATVATSDHHEFDPLEKTEALRFHWIR